MARINYFKLPLLAAAVLLLAALGLVAAVEPAHAAFPGQNGRIFFDYEDQISSINPDGTALKTLPESPAINPSVSPDGSKIVFSRGSVGDIWTVNTDGTGLVDLTNTPNNEDVYPAFSPDGSKITYTQKGCDNGGGRCVFEMNADGSNQTNLTYTQGLADTSDHANWAPDGSKITFSSGAVYCPAGGVDIWTMNPAGSSKTDLTCNVTGTTSDSDIKPAYAPDGTKIAFLSDRRDGSGYERLYTMNSDGSGITQTPTGFPFSLDNPDWGVAPVHQNTTLTLAAKPTSVTKGRTATLSGKLATTSGKLYAGQKVTIQQKPSGSSSYRTVKAVATNFGGALKLTVKPTKTTYYRAVYGGNTTLALGSSTSPARLVKVR